MPRPFRMTIGVKLSRLSMTEPFGFHFGDTFTNAGGTSHVPHKMKFPAVVNNRPSALLLSNQKNFSRFSKWARFDPIKICSTGSSARVPHDGEVAGFQTSIH